MNKALIFLSAIAISITSCNKSNEEELTEWKFDPETKIVLRPSVPTKSIDDSIHSAHYVVVEANEIQFHKDILFGESKEGVTNGFVREYKDTINDVINLPSYLIIDETDGSLICNMIDGHDFLLRKSVYVPFYGTKRDTLGYIPNAVVTDAKDRIKAAYEKRDLQEMYRLFETAFVFTPITGKKWLELKAKGLN